MKNLSEEIRCVDIRNLYIVLSNHLEPGLIDFQTRFKKQVILKVKLIIHLFRNSVGGKVTIFIVYADDIIIKSDDEPEIVGLKRALSKEFKIKDLGVLKYFLVWNSLNQLKRLSFLKESTP